ncbi:MAG TPA: aminotransferase class I/II-fold pyridoxal phosphate-dependent enzyme [Candidatus Angelobacter sp.]|jgi:aspartate/methionine/tyrosine aminotransferase|nr:aminotransferase class I/II-fold pyridoxal phosphate-dependent enzyme [Candidatus Angelobacter sp.]
MDFQNFDLEFFQSQFERMVEINLADSSVKCANVSDLLAGEDPQPLLEMPLYYPEVNGTGLLRERIAALYPNASSANVLVTVGAAQANWMVCSTLLEHGDEVIVVSPGYRQVWGLAKNTGCLVKETHLRPENSWRLDMDELESLAGPRTKLISIVNPNNPTGSILSHEEMQRIASICRKTGAWLHADEVYRGTELACDETPSFWGMYERVICVNSMSKAYGLAGLRIGWAVASPETVEELWRRHEYAVIAASGPSMKLAEIALQPAKREMLLDRQRRLSREGHAVLEQWVRAQEGRFSVSKAVATSIAFVGYNFDMPSAELADHIRRKASVLVAPGGYLGTENHLRITVGYEPEKVRTALERIGAVAAELAGTAQAASRR